MGQLAQPHEYVSLIQEKLPPAFQTVGDELKGNLAVGLLREQVIVGMLIAFLGESNVSLLKSAVQADIDCHIMGQALSIKTVSQGGGIRIKWTANAVMTREFMESYVPRCDLLIVRIVWGGAGYIRYVPLTVQQEVSGRLGAEYLDYRTSTNTRGVNISTAAEAIINRHRDTTVLPVDWFQSEIQPPPYKKWVDYWKEGD